MMSTGPTFPSRKKFGFIQSLWFKLLLITGVVVIISAAVGWGVFIPVNHLALEKELQEKGQIIANFVLSFNISSYYKDGKYPGIQKMIEFARDKKRASILSNILYIFVTNTEGQIIAQTPEDIVSADTSVGPLQTSNPIPSGNAVAHKQFSLSLSSSPASNVKVMDTAILVLPGQQAELHVGIRVGSRSYFSTYGVGIGVTLLLVLVLGVGVLPRFISSQIQRPVEQLVRYVTQIGQGNMDYALTLNVKNELAVLGESLKDMVERLKGMVQTESDINRMQGQIMNMLSTVSAAADGNLTVEAEVTADALGSLADAFNMMVASLASLVEQVRNSATDISTATNAILASSAQMIKGAEEQQNHINNITSAVDEIAVSMQQVANNAEAAARASQMATEAAQKGEKSVEETIRGMHRIRNTVQVTSKKIKSLGDRSIEIGEIVTTIDDIARQTTILALNAAIEAARAGEHGRGFGVVAEEVRKLAERSSKATQDIGDLIKGIQVETNEAVRTMEEGTREVEEGTRLADIAGTALKEIDKSVGQVADLIQEISLAAKQQARGTDGVVKSMETISDITNLHAEGVRKTTETIEQLATLSDRLTEAIGNFKIRESDSKPELPGRKAITPQRPPQMVPVVQQPSGLPEFSHPSDEDEEELITEEDFFKAS
jgi:methyl-accepting chemotaxis protein